MKKIVKSILCFLTIIVSVFALSACSLSEVSIEDAYNEYVEKVDLEALRNREYLEAKVTDIKAELVEGTESTYNLTTFEMDIIIQPNKFYICIENSAENTIEDYLFKNESDNFYMYYRKNSGGVTSEILNEEKYIECKNKILDILYNEKILPSSIEEIESTDVLISGLTSVKVFFTNLSGEACSVSIGENLRINESIIVSSNDTYSTIIKYSYPYGWNYTDIPNLV